MELTLSTFFSGVTLNPFKAQSPTARMKTIGALALLLIVAVGVVYLWHQNRKIAAERAEIVRINNHDLETALADVWIRRKPITAEQFEQLCGIKGVGEYERLWKSFGSPRLTKAQLESLKYSLHPYGTRIRVGTRVWVMSWEDDPKEINQKRSEIKAAVEAQTKQFQRAYCSDSLLFSSGITSMFAQMEELSQARAHAQ